MNKIKYLLMLSVAFVAFSLTSCNDDDEYFDSKYQSREIVINQIYLEDYESSVPDRPVDFARLGQMIRIEGSGLYGMKQVLVNGYDTYFNRTYVTDNSMLITLNESTPITEAEDGVRNTIVFVKDKTQITYNFEIKAASPTISRIDNTLPLVGELVTVYGKNLHETTSVELPGGIIIEGEDITNDDKDGSFYSFIMPEGVTEYGSIVSQGTHGTAKTPACFNLSDCMIINFDGVGDLGSWGDTYSSDDLADDPVPGSNRGKCVPVIPESIIANGGIQPGNKGLGWFTAGNGYDLEDWSRMYEYIPAETSVKEVAFQFDLYCPDEWSTGQLEFTFQNNLSGYGYGSTETTNTTNITYPMAVMYIPWFVDEEERVPYEGTGDRWETITIPISSVGKYQNEEANYTFQNLVEDRMGGSYCNFGMYLVNTNIEIGDDPTDLDVYIPAEDFVQMIYTDNWRIVPYKSYVVSDYPEDDEE